MISENALYWIWITNSLGYNNIKIKKIFDFCDDIKAFYFGGLKKWRLCRFFSQSDIEKLKNTNLEKSNEIILKCNELGYSIIAIDDVNYPKCLYNIDTPPAVIYVNGELPDVDNILTVSVVGTRKATRYGVDNSYKFAYALSKYGVVIVSGGAIGVDCASHFGSLAANGKTVCVLGCGINYKYLTDTLAMRNDIAKTGAVISEYPPDEPPKRYYFPARNRIISALADGVIVMEAGIKSGSLITANIALEQGKEVFALLGNNSPQNAGSNKLIKEGTAHPVTDFMDVLSEFNNNRGIYIDYDLIQFDFSDISAKELEAIPVKLQKSNSNDKNKDILKKDIAEDKKDEKIIEKTKNIEKNDVGLLIKLKNEKISKNKNTNNNENKSIITKNNSKDNVNLKNNKHIINEKEKTRVNIKDFNLTETAEQIYECIYEYKEPIHIDIISEKLNIPVFKVLTAITQLEMCDLVVAKQGRQYVLK